MPSRVRPKYKQVRMTLPEFFYRLRTIDPKHDLTLTFVSNISTAILNYVDAVECLNHLALAYENMSDYDNARLIYKRAIGLLEAPTGIFEIDAIT